MADVTIEATIQATTGRGVRAVVFTTQSIGYVFYVNGTSNDFTYTKTTDGGATWGAGVAVSAKTTITAFDVWFDQWTTGDTGTKIHTWYINDSTDDDPTYRSLDTNGDTLGTEVASGTGTSVVGSGSSITGTKTESGYLYQSFNLDGGAEFSFNRSTDNGATWSSGLDGSNFNEGSVDVVVLFPAHGTGDPNDVWAIYQDNSATAVTMKLYDSSAGTTTESSTISAINARGTDLTQYQYPFSGTIRQSDGHIIWGMFTDRDAATCDFLMFDTGSVAAGVTTGTTALTNITTDIDDMYWPVVFIDNFTNNLYVGYVGKRDGSETLGSSVNVYYTASTDGGSTWSAGDTAYRQGAAANILQTWGPITGPRFYMFWRPSGAGTLVGNFVNSLAFASVTSIKTVEGLAKASVKTVNGLAIASVKTVEGLA